ncbi:choice-of-anchor C family protein [Sphaerisporangium album]|uniref:Choice-of-anchor C family protein n=2 Tax=Sphaerisporangium album TaxID=509200 RepID=A0A367FU83_9ACTN|nr:choice-of-anchor C family protein [Sphaerisporangium album]
MVGALAALATVTGAPADATTVRFNGGFETPAVGPGSFRTFAAGRAIGAWTVGGGSVDLAGRGFWQAAEGVQALDLNGSGPGAITQTFGTLPLVKYEIAYRLAGDPGGEPAVKSGVVRIGGEPAQDFSFDVTGRSSTDMGYVRKKVTFIATGLSTTVEFLSTVPGHHGPVIDDITVKSCLAIICHI